MASTFEGWTEGMVFSIIFILIFGVIVIGGMNNLHDGEDFEVEGLDTSSMEASFNQYQENQEDSITGGEASFLSAVGLTLGTSWNIITSLFSMLMVFVAGGGWIETVVKYMMLPDYLSWALRGLWITALGFIILRILFKVKT